MRDLLPKIDAWLADGKSVALATVVEAWGSAPRPLGAKMAVTADGEIAGSVSGGCVEGAVFEEAQGVLASGRPTLVSYGVSQDTAWSVGLSCGGRISILIEPLDTEDRIYRALRTELDAQRPVAVATVLGDTEAPQIGNKLLIRGDSSIGDAPGTPGIDGALRRALTEHARVGFERFASMLLGGERGGSLPDGTPRIFLDVHPPSPQLIVVGAVHVAIPLVEMAQRVGFRAFVVDPRTAFATPQRFAHADGLVTEWPDVALPQLGLTASTYLALLSHDLKLDIPALEVALRSPVRYIGALGSKKTHSKRVVALAERGFDDLEIARIHNPIGLNLGGRRAEEMAVSILAEVVAVRHGIGLKARPPVREL